MTEKLYYQDSHRKEFEAQVVSCQWNEKKEWYEVILDRTVFFPEGGGQYADPGVIDGIPVEDVKEREGEVIHMMKKPLTTRKDFPECSSTPASILYLVWCTGILDMTMWAFIWAMKR